MPRSLRTILLNSILILLLISTAAMSAVPPYMNYQGRLTDSGGNPVDTTSNITFTLYTDDGSLTQLWTETQLSVVVTDGLFQVFLGLYNPMTPDLFDGATRLIGIKLGDGPENTPLLPIVSVAYAQKAGHVDTAAYAHAGPGGGSPWTSDGSSVYLNNSDLNVGIGDSSPTSKLVVDGDIWSTGVGAFGGPIYGRKTLAAYASGTMDTFAVWGTNTNGTAAGFYSNTPANVAPGTPTAVYARAGGNAIAGNFSALGNGMGLNVYSAGSGDALRAFAAGSSYSGRFGGGLGVLVSGDLLVTGAFRLSTGGADGHVLTSDATGTASWQAPSGGSPWTSTSTKAYLSDTTLSAAIGMTNPQPGMKLSIQTNETGGSFPLWVRNSSGTAAAFFSGVTGSTGYPGVPAAVYARSEGGNDAGLFSAIDGGRGLVVSASGTGSALQASNSGTGYAGRFNGGSGILVESDLRVIGTTVGDDAVDLPDNSISSAEMFDEPGIAANFDPTVYVILTDASMQDLSVVTITTPSPGFILVEGKCELAIGGTTNASFVYSQIDETAGGTFNGSQLAVGFNSHVDATAIYVTTSPSNVYFKPAGTYTFRLEAKKSSSGTSSATYASITAMFFHSSYGDVITTVSADDAVQFDNAELVSSDNNAEPLYQVDLRELELKAAHTRAEAEKAARELLDAQIRERDTEVIEEAGR